MLEEKMSCQICIRQILDLGGKTRWASCTVGNNSTHAVVQ